MENGKIGGGEELDMTKSNGRNKDKTGKSVESHGES